MCHLRPETFHAQLAEKRRGNQPIRARLADVDPFARGMALEEHMRRNPSIQLVILLMGHTTATNHK